MELDQNIIESVIAPSEDSSAPSSVTNDAGDEGAIGRARELFMSRLVPFLTDRDKLYRRTPIMAHKELDLFRLYWLVGQRGGYAEVTKLMKWLEIGKILLEMVTPPTGSSTKLRETYEKFLLQYERTVGFSEDIFATIDVELAQRKALQPIAAPPALNSAPGTPTSTKSAPESNLPPLLPPLQSAIKRRARRTKPEEDGSLRPLKRRPSRPCERCHTSRFSEADALVTCTSCHRSFHQLCHDPPCSWSMANINYIEWLCADCDIVKTLESCQLCGLSHTSVYNVLADCQRCHRRLHHFCQTNTSPGFPPDLSLWQCGDCIELLDKLKAEIASMSDAELRQRLQQTFSQNPNVSLAAVSAMSAVSVQACSEEDMILWVLSSGGSGNRLSQEQIASAVDQQFGFGESERVNAALVNLTSQGIVALQDLLYFIQGVVVVNDGHNTIVSTNADVEQ